MTNAQNPNDEVPELIRLRFVIRYWGFVIHSGIQVSSFGLRRTLRAGADRRFQSA
jgi:hypothetical protein